MIVALDWLHSKALVSHAQDGTLPRRFSCWATCLTEPFQIMIEPLDAMTGLMHICPKLDFYGGIFLDLLDYVISYFIGQSD